MNTIKALLLEMTEIANQLYTANAKQQASEIDVLKTNLSKVTALVESFSFRLLISRSSALMVSMLSFMASSPARS